MGDVQRVHIIAPLLSLSQPMTAIEAVVPDHRRSVTLTSGSSTVVERTYESNHPYANSMDEANTVNIPGARSITITFDPQTRTEAGCDWLRYVLVC